MDVVILVLYAFTFQGGGTCEAHDGTFTCFCPHNRAGQLCDIKVGYIKLTN